MPEPPDLDPTDHKERDAASIKILGFFFSVLGGLVLIGSYWSRENSRALTVSLVSGAVLTLVGLGMMYLVSRNRGKN